MIRFFKRFWQRITTFFKKLQPGEIAWKGASKAIIFTTAIIWIAASSAFFIIPPRTWFGIFPVILGLGLGFLVSAAVMLGLRLIRLFPKRFLWTIPGTVVLAGFIFGQGSLGWQFPTFIILFSGAAGAGIYSLTKPGRSSLTLIQKITAASGTVIGFFGLIWGLIWLFDTGEAPEIAHINAAEKSAYRPAHIKLSNPAEPGTYEVAYLTYGSGKDKQRPEFAENATIITDSVDASRLLDNWEGLAGKLRTKYWGVDEKSLPINGRVWYPKGDGPFPLALIVHGNHGMHDYSDPGYEYLGRLLASQGIILTSVDENFINSGWTDIFGDGLNEENDARGWLLLEHLKNWKKWNESPGSLFEGKIDMDNLAVMGHSRGGEAAAIAGFFNKLPYYPDDAKQVFDYNFNIKSVVAIAPVDGQYTPGDVGTPLENVNYLVLHGANDGDVQSFNGLRQYERTSFTDTSYHFKSAVYIYGANHGQFNTSWGNTDSPQPWASLLNLKALMPMEDQLTIGKVYISAFLQATLQGKKGYERLFEDYRTGLDWLPQTIYLNQYESSDWKVLADFEEDLDLTTTTSGAEISAENLTVWREQRVSMKYGHKATRAAYLGWDSLAYNADTARFKLTLESVVDATETPWLTFELSDAKENTYPDKERDEELKKESNNNQNEEETKEEEDKSPTQEDEEEKAPDPLDFSILISDSNGETVTLKLSDYSYLQRQVTVDVLKNPELQSTKTSEAIYNTFYVDLTGLINLNPTFNNKAIALIEFIFDANPKGVIILDKLAVH